MKNQQASLPDPLVCEPALIADIIARLRDGTFPVRTEPDGFPLFEDDPGKDWHYLISPVIADGGFLDWITHKRSQAVGDFDHRTKRHTKAVLPALLRRIAWNVLHWFRDDSRRGNLDALALLMETLLARKDASGVEIWETCFSAFEWPSDSKHMGVDRDELLLRLSDWLALPEMLSSLEAAAIDQLSDAAVHQLRVLLEVHRAADHRHPTSRLVELLERGEPIPLKRGEVWSNAAIEELGKLPLKERNRITSLLRFCGSATSSSPSKKWLQESREKIKLVDEPRFIELMSSWLPLVALPNPGSEDWMPDPKWMLQKEHELILRGLAWSCTGLEDPAIAQALGDVAEASYKKIPEYGPRCPKVGNACLLALCATITPEATAQLTRLQSVVKQPTARKMISKALDKAAQNSGQSREDLEETNVPTGGLDEDGCLRQAFGEYTAEFRITAVHDAKLVWIRPDGRGQTSVPADVKRSHAEELKKFRRASKDLTKMLVAHRDRIERLLSRDRCWPLAQWRERYPNHPLVSIIAKKLIWHFRRGEQSGLGMHHNGRLVDSTGKPLDWVDDRMEVRLWHPIGFEVDMIVAWRRFLEEHEICQPFKQAHREVYLLTDAELQTGTYSNRFAAHIIRQHQFAELAKQRGWKYNLMGQFDSYNTPHTELAHADLRVEFWVNPTDDFADSGIGLYLSTHQVRFVRDDQAVDLTEVPAMVFSEVMRDVDLFVGGRQHRQ